MEKSLDRKLAAIHANPNTNEFILADAKDADMAFGISAPGKSPEHVDGQYRSLSEYRDIIRENTRQGLVDIMLMSVSTSEIITIQERLFDSSAVTPAIRANDTTDVWAGRESNVFKQASRTFRTALIDHAQCAQLEGDESLRGIGANLGLYSVTFNNDRDLDHEALEHYKAFRMEAERKGFRHFLEIFDPNAPSAPIDPALLGGFINDLVARTLAGVASPGRPIFLKMVYHGPKAMEELANYDPHLVPGILGGSSGTTYDAFKLLAEAKKYGAKAALFGRKINNSEHQLSFIQFLRWLADGEITPEEAVKAYHGVLEKMGIKPFRPYFQDCQLTSTATSYGGSGVTISLPSGTGQAPQSNTKPTVSTAGAPATPESANENTSWPTTAGGDPDFSSMTSEQRLAYHRKRLDDTLGRYS
jgi:hypothetical protein